MGRRRGREGQRLGHQWRVGNDPIRFQAAARREQNLWLGIINAHVSSVAMKP